MPGVVGGGLMLLVFGIWVRRLTGSSGVAGLVMLFGAFGGSTVARMRLKEAPPRRAATPNWPHELTAGLAHIRTEPALRRMLTVCVLASAQGSARFWAAAGGPADAVVRRTRAAAGRGSQSVFIAAPSRPVTVIGIPDN